jgi:predicted dehydrogenase
LGIIQGTTSAHRDSPLRIEVKGTEGSATLEGSRLTIWEPGREERFVPKRFGKGLEIARREDFFGTAHRRQLKEIFAALREGREPPIEGEEARKAVEIVLGIYRSAAKEERVTFPLESEAGAARRPHTTRAEER